MLNLVLDGIISLNFSLSLVCSASVIDRLVGLLPSNQFWFDNIRLVAKLFSTYKSIHSRVGIHNNSMLRRRQDVVRCILFCRIDYSENIR